MAAELPLALQTTYAELVERCWMGRLADDFSLNGSFIQRRAGAKSYWYFRHAMEAGTRREQYVGPATPALDAKVAAHQGAKADWKGCRAMVVALQRAGLGGPQPIAGRILEELSMAGVFRLRGVVVGTVAYQTYAGLLGVKLGSQSTQTADLDLAQFRSISVAVDDSLDLPLLEVLRRADPRFAGVVPLAAGEWPTQFRAGEFRVDILVPNRGRDTADPTSLPALQAYGTPLRFLDYLIYREVQAAVLHGGGIAVNVPAPERFALHKLLVSRARSRTSDSQVKARKDLQQAGALIAILADARPYELRDAWNELVGRGPKWRQYAREAVSLLDGIAGSPSARLALEGALSRGGHHGA